MVAIPNVKRLLIGDPRATGEIGEQVLPPWLALPVFASDTLSAVAYATEEMLIVLALAGAAATGYIAPLSFAVAALMVIVIASYRQTVRAYPGGGGAYLVARANLGEGAGLLAAAALLIDYTLTVAVSVAAGTSAVVSAFPRLQGARIVVALTMLSIITVTNLRGVRDAGLIVALPAYTFVLVMFAMIGRGLVACVGGCPEVPFVGAGNTSEVVQGVGVLLIARAFSTGATALTGVEAVSNGVNAFEAPQSRNAARTLGLIGVLAVPLVVGIGWLADNINGVVAFEGVERTVTSQIAAAVWGAQSPGFYAVQVSTAAILFLAANTAFADFPRLASVLARDSFMPSQLESRGDRLVFSNGILVLSAAAALLLVASGGRVTLLVALFVVGVFTAFSLSQAGMVRHWLRTRDAGWELSVVLNAVGCLATTVVLVVVMVTKFTSGAWMVLVAAPALVALMSGIRRHYASYARTVAELPPMSVHASPLRAIILEDRVNAATAAAVGYAYGVGAAPVRGMIVPTATRRTDTRERWRQMAPSMQVGESTLGLRKPPAQAMRDAAVAFAEEEPDAFNIAIVPETRSDTWVDVVRRHGIAQRLKARLVSDGSVMVTNVVAPIGGPGPYQVVEPIEHHVVVLVNQVHEAAARAISYAMSLQSSSVQALTVNVSGERSRQILTDWQAAGIPIPLEIIDSPYRSLVESVQRYVEDFRPDGQHTVTTVVMSEFVLARWWQRSLHNQTVLQLKSNLLFSRGVVTTSVPTRLTVKGTAHPRAADPRADGPEAAQPGRRG